MGHSGDRFFAEGRRNRVENQIWYASLHQNKMKANEFTYHLFGFNAISNTRYKCVSCVKFLFRAPKNQNHPTGWFCVFCISLEKNLVSYLPAEVFFTKAGSEHTGGF
jgi:hypothetical protein